jgi:hypothetical protein
MNQHGTVFYEQCAHHFSVIFVSEQRQDFLSAKIQTHDRWIRFSAKHYSVS